MSVRIHLQSNETRPRAALLALVLCAAWIALFALGGSALGRHGLLHWEHPDDSFLTRHARAAYDEVIHQFDHPALAANFLENRRSLPAAMRMDVQKAGVMHLLALSGAQIGLSVALTAHGSALLALALARICGLPLARCRRLARGVAHAAEALAALAICALFGWGGSLMRAAALRHLRFPGANDFKSWCRAFPLLREGTQVSRIGLPLCGICFVFGDALQNPAFLLSLLGSLTLQASARLLDALGAGGAASTGVFRWEKALLVPACTACTMSLVLAPLFPTDPATAVVANLLAIPLVDAGIAPLSLLLLAAPAKSALRGLCAELLDAGFASFEALAAVLGRSSETLPQARIPWEEGAGTYLLCLTLLAWLGDAFFRSRAAGRQRQRWSKF